MLTRVCAKHLLRTMLSNSTALLTGTRAVHCTARLVSPHPPLTASASLASNHSMHVHMTNPHGASMHTRSLQSATAAAAAASTRMLHSPMLQRIPLASISPASLLTNQYCSSQNIRCVRCLSSDRPSINDLEGGMSSETIGIDEAAIDAIPADSMPAGAARTEGPPPPPPASDSTPSSQPEMSPDRANPQPDSSIPPSGPSGLDHDQHQEGDQPPAGKPRSSGPEISDSSSVISGGQPEVQEPPSSVNPDRIPFWGS